MVVLKGKPMAYSPKEKKKRAIREAATKLFAKKGFASATTRDVSKAAKISNAALYYYFRSKEELLYDILDETMTSGLARIQEIEAGHAGLKEKLTAILKIHTTLAVDYNKMKLLVHNLDSLTPAHRQALVENQRQYVKTLIALLEALKQEGVMVDLDTKVCAFAFFGMVSWAYRWYDPEGPLNPEQLSEILNRIFTRGIFKDPTA
jgi:AcrR family transcriptional regulator